MNIGKLAQAEAYLSDFFRWALHKNGLEFFFASRRPAISSRERPALPETDRNLVSFLADLKLREIPLERGHDTGRDVDL